MEGVVFFAMGLIFYFLPGLIGNSKKNSTAIWMLNLFLGWTLVGWVVALVWACTTDPEPARIIHTTTQPASQPQPINNRLNELERLKNLYDNGTLTQSEFESEKLRILGKPSEKKEHNPPDPNSRISAEDILKRK